MLGKLSIILFFLGSYAAYFCMVQFDWFYVSPVTCSIKQKSPEHSKSSIFFLSPSFQLAELSQLEGWGYVNVGPERLKKIV